MQQCHLGLASEFKKFRNIPSLDSGAAILQEIRLLRQDVTKMQQDVTGIKEDVKRIKEDVTGIKEDVTGIKEDVTGIQQDLTRMHTRLTVADANNIARLANSLLIAPDAALQPLLNVETYEPIDRFPATPQEIQGLTGPVVNSILRALGASTQGTIDRRKTVLRVQIGLKADPI